MNNTAGKREQLLGWILLILFSIFFTVLITDASFFREIVKNIFPGQKELLYPRASLSQLMGEHLLLVFLSSILALIIALPLGIFITRRKGIDFKTLINDLGAFSQTIPPVAVLALAVPAIGFGFKPTILALFLYSLLPILRNTVAGIEDVPAEIKEAARGMGMTNRQLLFRIELPLAAPVIFSGIRISVVINVGTATIGAVVGAGGLGIPIISGLIQNNPAFVFEGAVTAALLAILLDQLIRKIETKVTRK